jgi:membrane-associated phospholipid phosphatase
MIPVRARVTAVLTALAAIAVVSACRQNPAPDPRMLSQWTHALYGAMRVERLSPPVASRLAAYWATAVYGGLAATSPSMPSLVGVLQGVPELPRAASDAEVDGALVAVAAQRLVLDTLMREALPTTRAALGRLSDSIATARIAVGITDSVRSRSEALGRRIGLLVVGWASADGFAGTRGRPYVPPVGEGLWINDAPANTFATQSMSGVSEFVATDNPGNLQRAANTSDRALILSRPKSASVKTMPAVNMSGISEPYWHESRPFVLATWKECAVAPPPAYSTDTASLLYRNARAVYDTAAALTEEQRTTAYFWADNAGESGTPVGHWLSIASQTIGARKLSAHDAARLLLATAVAQADAFIAAWGYKYQYNLLRPRTYIRRVIDSTWEPLIGTPPFPEYPSGHSTQSAAAAAVIAGLVGEGPFHDSTSISIGHSVRAFRSFQAASEEAGMSRVYGGLHYPEANRRGLELGRCIGERVAERMTRPAHSATR